MALVYSKNHTDKTSVRGVARKGRNPGRLKITGGLEKERFPPPVVPVRPACALSPGRERWTEVWSCKTVSRVCSKQFPYKSNIKSCWCCSPEPESGTLNHDHVELSPQTRTGLRSAWMVHLKGRHHVVLSLYHLYM